MTFLRGKVKRTHLKHLKLKKYFSKKNEEILKDGFN